MRTKFNFRKDQLAAKNRLDAQIKAAEAERQKQIELQKKIEAEAAAGKSLSQIGRENFTGEGQAFERRSDTFSGGKVKDTGGVPGGKYGSPRKDGGLINGYDDGGMVYLYDRQEMSNGGSADDDYEPSDFSKKVNELMDDGYDFGEAVREAMRQGYNKGGSVKKKKDRKDYSDGGRVYLYNRLK